jgi:hypothetical protein
MLVLLSVSFLIGSSIILFFRLKEDEHRQQGPIDAAVSMGRRNTWPKSACIGP